MLLCGRYEGFDERIRQGLRPREISIGDFICNGGEVPAMVVIDTVIRYVPGVLGDENSVTEESHSVPGPRWSIRNIPGRAYSTRWRCRKFS